MGLEGFFLFKELNFFMVYHQSHKRNFFLVNLIRSLKLISFEKTSLLEVRFRSQEKFLIAKNQI